MALLRRRDTLQLAAVGLSAAALGLGRYAWAGSAEAAGADAALTTVAPELRDAAIKVIAATRGFHPMGADRLPMLRAALATAKTPEGSAIPVRVERVPVGPGRPAVTVYVINERPGAVARPAILHTHGGGFVTGSALLELPGLIAIAGELDCVIVSVEYRLSPEVTWRESLAETWAALRWLYADAASLGVDPRRIAVFGESAGGGHAALLALRARDSGDVPLAFQCLIYPMLDDRTGTTRFPEPGFGTIGWDAEANRYGWRAFLGVAPATDAVPDEAVPMRAASLRGLPATFIGVGAIDLFAPEDIAYAQRLNASGVPCELLVLPGAFHGFDKVAPDASLSRRLAAARIGALRQGLAQTLAMTGAN